MLSTFLLRIILNVFCRSFPDAHNHFEWMWIKNWVFSLFRAHAISIPIAGESHFRRIQSMINILMNNCFKNVSFLPSFNHWQYSNRKQTQCPHLSWISKTKIGKFHVNVKWNEDARDTCIKKWNDIMQHNISKSYTIFFRLNLNVSNDRKTRHNFYQSADILLNQ